MKYDVVISGASISGLYSGYKLAKAGLSVLILDRRGEIGTPVRCGEATGNRKEIERFFPYNESTIACKLEGLAVHLNGEEKVSASLEETGVILKRDKFEQYIAKLATEAGAEIRLNTTVAELLPSENGRFPGIKTKDDETVQAQYIIGCDGAESFIGRAAGLTTFIRPRDAFTSLQYRVKSDDFSDKKMHFFVGSKTIPQGYIWVFPKENGELSVGAGLFGSHREGERARDYLESFMNEFFPDCEKTKLITGCAPLSISPRKLVKQNVLIVGDAARMVNPLTAGGIMNALEAADIMGNALIESHTKESLKPLKQYTKRWNRAPRFTQKVFFVFKELFQESKDSEIENTLHVAYRFLSKADRSKLFTMVPVSSLFHLMRLYTGRFLKHVPFLIRE